MRGYPGSWRAKIEREKMLKFPKFPKKCPKNPEAPYKSEDALYNSLYLVSFFLYPIQAKMIKSVHEYFRLDAESYSSLGRVLGQNGIFWIFDWLKNYAT